MKKKKKSQILFLVKKDDFFFSPRLGGGRGRSCFVFGFVVSFAFVFLMFTVHGVWKGNIWGRGGLEKEQSGGLGGPLRGSARVRRAEFGWGKERFGLEGGLPSSRAHLLRSSSVPGSAWK